MLLQFIRENRSTLIERTRAKVRRRAAPLATPEEIENGVPLFLSQFTDLLASTRVETPATPAIDSTATKHGSDLLKRGFTIAQLVHDYGDICQAVTELAGEQKKRFDTGEFHLLNLCLDNAIAESVTEFSRQHDKNAAGEEAERLGFLAHELRNLTSTATLAFQLLQAGTVAIGGSTGAVLGRSLTGLRDLVDRTLSEVRLASGLQRRTRFVLAEFIEEIELSASLDAKGRGIHLSVARVPCEIRVEADHQLLASAVSNLLQNAFKFTRAGGQVALRAAARDGRVIIDVEDECGGLPAGKAEELFRPFERRGTDLSGLGLGLAISRRSVGANGGEIQVKNMPGKGCIFTIELPIAAEPADRGLLAANSPRVR